MSDLISRADAINVFTDKYPKNYMDEPECGGMAQKFSLTDIKHILNGLPSTDLNNRGDLISKEDVINALTDWMDSTDYDTAREWAEDIIRDLPSAESEVIRCKDCKHYHKFIATLSKTSQAVWDEYCGKFRGSVTADDFCSRAERKEEE